MKASNALMALILFLGMALMVSATPVLDTINNQMVNENSTLVFSVSAATYAGTDTLEFFVSPNLPVGATFTVVDNKTRSFSWTPTFDQAGLYTLTFRVAEQHNASATDSKIMNITVNNFNVAISASDPDAQALTYTVIGQGNTTIASCSISGSSLVATRGSSLFAQGAKSTQCTVQVSDGSLTASALYTVGVDPKSMLSVDKVEVIVAGDSSTLDNGEEFDVLPGDTLEFKVKIANLYTSDDDIDIININGNIEIDDWKDGDSENWDNAKDIDLRADRTGTLDFKISNVPDDITDGTHKVTLIVEGKDDKTSGVRHKVTMTFSLNVNKENEDIRIVNPVIDPSTVSCDRTAVLSVKLSNLGTDDSDEIVFTARNPLLGINIVDQGIDLSEGDSTSKEYSIVIPKTAVAKSYPIMLTTFFDSTRYDDNDNSNTKTIQLVVEACAETPIVVPPPKTCTPAWSCGDWSECVASKQSRICTDSNSCGVSTGKPSESQTCVVPAPAPAEKSIFEGNGIYIIGGLILLNVLLLVGIVALFVKLLRR
jgi:hypothetical protein